MSMAARREWAHHDMPSWLTPGSPTRTLQNERQRRRAIELKSDVCLEESWAHKGEEEGKLYGGSNRVSCVPRSKQTRLAATK